MEAFIRQIFEQNYEELRLESGHAISPDVKERALNEVLLYWRKLHAIAKSVTDTEVRLSLSNLETTGGRDYSIEGVVDIVREQDNTMMYDIKTHNAEYVRANNLLYEQQLNVYAYIWKELRKQDLNGMAIIATDYPESIQEALTQNNQGMLEYAMNQWDPIIPIQYDRIHVDETIREFGDVVDAIEDNRFSPRSLEDLKSIMPHMKNMRFASKVCHDCDARFSCKSYRQYAWSGIQQVSEQSLKQYFGYFPPDLDQENWRTAGLDSEQTPDEIRSNLPANKG
jgi:hypothetical protein